MTDDPVVNSRGVFGEGQGARWEMIHRRAIERFGGGEEGRFNPELELRLRILRRMLGLDAKIWSDRVLAMLTRGHEGSDAATHFNRIKRKGDLRVDAAMASMLAGVVNYVLAIEPAWPSRPTERQLEEVVAWIDQAGRKPARPDDFRASDINGDVLAMARRLSSLIATHGFAADAPDALGRAHGEIVDRLTALYEVAQPRRLIIQPSDLRPSAGMRFGSDLAAYGEPRDWIPLEFKPGVHIEYGVTLPRNEARRGWLVTIRDVRSDDRSSAGGPHAWDEGWDRVVRWLPGAPFDIPPGAEVRAPTSAANAILDIPGRFHVFLLIEPSDSNRLSEILKPRAGIPSISGYLSLAAGVEGLKDGPIEVYASSYLVDV